MRRNSIHEPPDLSDVNIIMLGLTGSGKSASGNTIIGVRDTFKENYPSSVTRVCESAQTVVDGQTITVIDIVGLSDTSVKITDAQTHIERIFTHHSVDVFLLVIKLGKTFRKESSKVVKWIQDHFGEEVLKHTLVLFTHGDQLHEPIEKYLSKCKALRSVVDQCSGGFHVFNNKDEDRSQVTELLKKINTPKKKKNQYMRYTKLDYKTTQDELLHRKCVTGAAIGVLVLGVIVALAGIAAVVVSERAAAGGLGEIFAAGAAAREDIASLMAGEVLRGIELTGAAKLSTMGAVALTAGQAAIIGAAGVALLAVAVGAGVYLKKKKKVTKRP